MTGSTIWAPRGDKGPTGDKGPVGDQGPVGPQGPPGPGAGEFNAFKALIEGPTGAYDVGKGTSNVGAILDTLSAAVAAINNKAVVASIASGALNLNRNTARTFTVSMSESITSLTFSGASGGQTTVIEAFFIQFGTAPARTITVPANVVLPTGVTNLVSNSLGSVTHVSFTSVDGGSIWYARINAIYGAGTPAASLPPLSGDNSTFNDEGDSTTGWTPSNATLSVSGSRLRQTKTAGGSNSSMTKAVTFPPSNTDYLYYGKTAVSLTGTAVVWFLNGAKEVSLWFGSSDGGGSNSTAGTMSLVGTTGASTRNVVSLGSGYDYTTNGIEYCLQFDSKYSTISCWFKEADGKWKFKARAACDWFSAANVAFLTSTPSAAGTWIEFDYVTLARPNIISIGDSITEGKTLFSPNPALALTDDSTLYQRYANIYPGVRNNLIVDKGVGGQTDPQIQSRVAVDVVNQGAKICIYGHSSNNVAGSVTAAAGKTAMQTGISACGTAGIAVIVINGSNGTQAGADNQPTPALRDYQLSFWSTQVPTLTGVAIAIDITQPTKDSNNFLAAANAADSVHWNATGANLAGSYIKSFQ